MKLIPHSKCSFFVQLDKSECKERLSRHIGKVSYNNWKREPVSAFSGKLDVDGFKVRRNIDYKNGFIPILSGIFVPESDGTNIEITAKMSTGTILLMSAFYSFISIPLMGALYTDSIMFKIIPMFMMVFGWVLINTAFWYEQPRSISKLKDLLNEKC
ncbi:hypothetical protein [Moritella sp.]|uniref:hypothetical protein n=1 Tax=Moritella sp. TaxID=78556 RepID=UPI001D1B6502|nr:hypothetical protein [Moritella sp.]MCJ8352069.1 hypothetical protein [Moritella sp.]NQZ42177.1 hypothetical protein [Moritella sp.]